MTAPRLSMIKHVQSHATSSERLPLWIIVVQAILAYEWLISAMNKIVNPHYETQLTALLRQSTHINPYGWYATLLSNIILPNHTIFAALDLIGELSIGVTLTFGVVLLLMRPHGRMRSYGVAAVCTALLGSAFLSLNYFFQGGTPLPWVNAGSSLIPGVDIDILIPLLSLTLFAANIQVLLAWRSRATPRIALEGEAA